MSDGELSSSAHSAGDPCDRRGSLSRSRSSSYSTGESSLGPLDPRALRLLAACGHMPGNGDSDGSGDGSDGSESLYGGAYRGQFEAWGELEDGLFDVEPDSILGPEGGDGAADASWMTSGTMRRAVRSHRHRPIGGDQGSMGSEAESKRLRLARHVAVASHFRRSFVSGCKDAGCHHPRAAVHALDVEIARAKGDAISTVHVESGAEPLVLVSAVPPAPRRLRDLLARASGSSPGRSPPVVNFAFTRLDLSGSKMGPVAFGVAARVAAETVTLVHVNLSGCAARGKAAARAIAAALGGGKRAKKGRPETPCTIETLDISDNEFGPASARYLRPLLHPQSPLRSLTLRGNPLGPDGVHQLMRGVGVTHVSHLDLSSTFNNTRAGGGPPSAVGENGGRVARTAVKSATGKSAAGRGNATAEKPIDSALRSISGVVSRSPLLTSLDLSHNPLGSCPAVGQTLFAVLMDNPGLEKIFLRDCGLGRCESEDLCAAVKNNCVITSIDVSYNRMPRSVQEAIGDAVARNGGGESTTGDGAVRQRDATGVYTARRARDLDLSQAIPAPPHDAGGPGAASVGKSYATSRRTAMSPARTPGGVHLSRQRSPATVMRQRKVMRRAGDGDGGYNDNGIVYEYDHLAYESQVSSMDTARGVSGYGGNAPGSSAKEPRARVRVSPSPVRVKTVLSSPRPVQVRADTDASRSYLGEPSSIDGFPGDERSSVHHRSGRGRVVTSYLSHTEASRMRSSGNKRQTDVGDRSVVLASPSRTGAPVPAGQCAMCSFATAGTRHGRPRPDLCCGHCVIDGRTGEIIIDGHVHAASPLRAQKPRNGERGPNRTGDYSHSFSTGTSNNNRNNNNNNNNNRSRNIRNINNRNNDNIDRIDEIGDLNRSHDNDKGMGLSGDQEGTFTRRDIEAAVARSEAIAARRRAEAKALTVALEAERSRGGSQVHYESWIESVDDDIRAEDSRRVEDEQDALRRALAIARQEIAARDMALARAEDEIAQLCAADGLRR